VLTGGSRASAAIESSRRAAAKGSRGFACRLLRLGPARRVGSEPKQPGADGPHLGHSPGEPPDLRKPACACRAAVSRPSRRTASRGTADALVWHPRSTKTPFRPDDDVRPSASCRAKRAGSRLPCAPAQPSLEHRHHVRANPRGWLYLAVVEDLYSRRIVGWATGTSLERTLTLDALRMALALRVPAAGLVHHSDRGSTRASTTRSCSSGTASAAA
jgi:transposase InsO family protein